MMSYSVLVCHFTRTIEPQATRTVSALPLSVGVFRFSVTVCSDPFCNLQFLKLRSGCESQSSFIPFAMSGTEDLDEALLRLESELDVVEAENAQLKEDAATALTKSAVTTESVVVAAESTVAAAPLPAWQQTLLERDLQQQRSAAAIRTEVRVLSAQQQYAEGANGSFSTAKPDVGNTGKQAPAPPQGKWEWNGTRWEWKTAKASSSSSVPVANGSQLAGPHLPETMAASIGPALPGASASGNARIGPKRPVKRMAAGEVWVDETLNEWPENDFRLFIGDLAPDASEQELSDAFAKYKSFNMVRIVKDKKSGKCRGYGFVSFARPEDMASCMKEMNGKYVGSRPLNLRKSNWQKRNLSGKRKKELKLFRTIAKHEK